MQKIIVLGCGLVGKVIAADLSTQFEVTVADVNPEALRELSAKHRIKTLPCDFTNKEELKKLLVPFNLVVVAVPGFMGFETLKAVIKAGKNTVDISFFPEDAFQLDTLAKKMNVTVVVDCGVAPGMCNMIAGYHRARMKMKRYECLVGGLPQRPEPPYNYKAVFSPIDVIEEYTRPARYVDNKRIVTKEALSDVVAEEFDGIGTLESFNSDGLRSLMTTLSDVSDMKEKTLRYPGHAALMKVFRETGLFSKDKISVNGQEVIPLEVTAKLLFPKWKMKEGDEDFTVMRVTVEGEEENSMVKYVYNLYDKFDSRSGTTSMARTTGYTCTAVANLVLEGQFDRKGISPPEFVGEDANCFKKVLEYLKARNVIYDLKRNG
jgi:saccharopine dehydrogenase-like NADP-dependent oxidoreductase